MFAGQQNVQGWVAEVEAVFEDEWNEVRRYIADLEDVGSMPCFKESTKTGCVLLMTIEIDLSTIFAPMAAAIRQL